jgi:ABC-type protease/lipase transport system fused ATPase/permease subunit
VQGVDKVLLLKDGALEMFGPRVEVLKRLMTPPRPAEVPITPANARLEESAA